MNGLTSKGEFMQFLATAGLLTGEMNIGLIEKHNNSQIKVIDKESITRAALDVGSGDTKITIAEVNLQTNKIKKIWLQTYKAVELRQDLNASQEEKLLSKKITLQLIDTLKEFQEQSSQYHPVEWAAVGTSVFRTAKNGKEVLEDVENATGIKIRIIPQLEEAKIGFASAVAASGEEPDNVISWDSGSGSFQITTLVDGKLEMYGTEFAIVPAMEMLFAIRNQPYSKDVSPNPISIEEAFELIKKIQNQLPEVPSWLLNNRKKLIGIGSASLFSIVKGQTGQSSYSQEDVKEAIFNSCGKKDSELGEFRKCGEVAVGLVLLYSVMNHCGFEQVTYCETTGCCEGLLITPQFWESSQN